MRYDSYMNDYMHLTFFLGMLRWLDLVGARTYYRALGASQARMAERMEQARAGQR